MSPCTVADRLIDETYEIRAKYLIGCDGANSKVLDDLDFRSKAKWG